MTDAESVRFVRLDKAGAPMFAVELPGLPNGLELTQRWPEVSVSPGMDPHRAALDCASKIALNVAGGIKPYLPTTVAKADATEQAVRIGHLVGRWFVQPYEVAIRAALARGPETYDEMSYG